MFEWSRVKSDCQKEEKNHPTKLKNRNVDQLENGFEQILTKS